MSCFHLLHQDLIALSLCLNKLKDWERLMPEIAKFKDLRALWLNDNPISENWLVC